MQTTQAGIDIAKSVFEVALSETPGTVRERHRLSRQRFRRFFEGRAATTVLMEACGSAHHWGRELQGMGHEVRLLHPGDVARYRDGNKTDRADAKAVLEAARNTALDPVPVKSKQQQAIAALHRMRQGYLQTRTARINAVRGHLREFGIVLPMGARHVVTRAETFHRGQGVECAHFKGRRYDCSRPHAVTLRLQLLREESRYNFSGRSPDMFVKRR